MPCIPQLGEVPSHRTDDGDGSRVRTVNRILSSVLDFVVIPAAATAAAVALSTLMPKPAEASPTWIEVYRSKYKVKPGTWGAELGMHGIASYVDARSIVRRGDFAYFNMTRTMLNKAGIRRGDLPLTGFGAEANCRTQTFTTSAGGVKAWGNDEPGNIGRFVCR